MGSNSTRESIKNAMQQRGQVMSKLGIKDLGEWIDIAGHVTYLLIDVTDAHAITQMMAELGLLGWLSAEIHPVVPHQEAAAALQ